LLAVVILLPESHAESKIAVPTQARTRARMIMLPPPTRQPHFRSCVASAVSLIYATDITRVQENCLAKERRQRERDESGLEHEHHEQGR